ncbi:hypothetical protein PSPO01_02495 [Paraphaeosphaeria sporulosa]
MKPAPAASVQTQGGSVRRVGFVYHRPPREQARRVQAAASGEWDRGDAIGSKMLLREQIVISSSIARGRDGQAPNAIANPQPGLDSFCQHNSISMTSTFAGREIASRWYCSRVTTEPFSVGRVPISGAAVVLGYPHTKDRWSISRLLAPEAAHVHSRRYISCLQLNAILPSIALSST